MQHNTNLVEFLNSNYATLKERKRLITRNRAKIIIYFKPRNIKGQTQRTGKQWIYIRLRVNGVRCGSDISTGICIELGTWDVKKKRIRGNSPKIDEKNRTLAKIEDDLLTLYNDLRQNGVIPTAKMMKELYTSKPITSPSLQTIYTAFLAYHVQKVRASSFAIHKSSFNSLVEYLTDTNQKDVTVEHISRNWGAKYHAYLIQKRQISISTANRLVHSISQVLDFAVFQDELESNPLRLLKLPKGKQKDIKFLTEAEIIQLGDYQFTEKPLQDIVNLFLFSCFTGLAYSDLMRFSPEKHQKTDPDGMHYISINRQKTGTLCFIPLIEEARKILSKYDGKPLPKFRNDLMNFEIKRAAEIAGIKNPNELTMHVARKTAGTLLLNRGIPLHIVSKVLGHTSVRTTEKHYASLLNHTVKTNFKKLGLI